MSSIQFWICDDFYQMLTYLFTFSRTVENIASWPWTFYRTRSSTGFWISPRLVPSRSLESPAERQVIDCFCVDANVLLVSCLFHACFMLVSCLFHACTCGKGPEALLTHDSYLSKSEELLLNIGQRRLKPWNNMLYCSCVPTWRVGFQQMSNEIDFRAETSPAPWLAIAKVGTPEIPSSTLWRPWRLCTGAPPKNFSKYFSQIRKAEQPQAQTEKFTGPKKRYIKKKNLKSTEFGTI